MYLYCQPFTWDWASAWNHLVSVMETCFLRRKHNGGEAAPPGGYLYEDNSCSEADAIALADKLRKIMKK